MHLVTESHFNDLRRKKGMAEGRDLSIRAVAREADIALATLLRVADSKTVTGVRVSTLEKLCKYFGVGYGELIEHCEDEHGS